MCILRATDALSLNDSNQIVGSSKLFRRKIEPASLEREKVGNFAAEARENITTEEFLIYREQNRQLSRFDNPNCLSFGID